jgi:prephenate dehydratase
MFYEKLTVTAAQLNTAANIAKDITVDHNYPTAARVVNNSGAIAYFIIFSASEYTAWLATPTLSDMVKVDIGKAEIINDLKRNVTKVIVLGTTGHTSDLYIEILKEGSFNG